jgi:hypothetical protein
MPSTLTGKVIMQGRFSSYLIGGNICNAFAIGDLGSTDEFFLAGAEPPGESNYPLLTGNILDSEGKVLFRLVRNLLVTNPGNCSKILSDHVGYEIHDSNGQSIFKISTQFQTLPGQSGKSFVTTLSANLYNRKGELVFQAHSGKENERIESNIKSVFGFNGEFGIIQGLDNDEISVARAMLATGGAIHRLISGPITGQTLSLDGAAVFNARLTDCELNVSTGEFVILGKENSFTNCHFGFSGPAENIVRLINQIKRG